MLDSNRAKIIVATTKKYEMPHDPVYLPLHVGAALRHHKRGLGYQTDDTGDNISDHNASYCELTGLYWAWKNLDADVIGLVHYRRYLGSPSCARRHASAPLDRILTGPELVSLFERADLIVPKKRRYYIETLASHYAHTHYQEQLDSTRSVIEHRCPEYLDTYDRVMNRTWGYMFNMMILRRELLEDYCNWLFGILAELENYMSEEELSSYQGRYIGRIAELIFNVWLEKRLADGRIDRSRMVELPLIYIEQVHWFRKVQAFLMAKFFHKKYEKSF